MTDAVGEAGFSRHVEIVVAETEGKVGAVGTAARNAAPESTLASVETLSGSIAPELFHKVIIIEGVAVEWTVSGDGLVADRPAQSSVHTYVQGEAPLPVQYDSPVHIHSTGEGRGVGIDRYRIPYAVCIEPARLDIDPESETPVSVDTVIEPVVLAVATQVDAEIVRVFRFQIDVARPYVKRIGKIEHRAYLQARRRHRAAVVVYVHTLVSGAESQVQVRGPVVEPFVHSATALQGKGPGIGFVTLLFGHCSELQVVDVLLVLHHESFGYAEVPVPRNGTVVVIFRHQYVVERPVVVAVGHEAQSRPDQYLPVFPEWFHIVHLCVEIDIVPVLVVAEVLEQFASGYSRE